MSDSDFPINISKNASPSWKIDMSETRLPCADPKWIQRVPVEQLGLKVLHTPTQEALVDIVAVHGLGAIPALTWKEKHSGVNWLEDASMLPSFVPRARIMAFGYDSIYVGRDPVKTSIYNIAKDLLEEVALRRAGFETRPLLFVGHCFGGLVVEKAILLSPIWNQAVLEATRGVVLLGTPHRGTETFSSQGQVLEAVAAGVAASAEGEKLYLEAGILEKLSTSSVDLANDPNDFARLCRSREIEICSFFETRSSDIGKLIGKAGIKEIVVDQSSARLDAEASFPLDVDHFALNKFARADDGNFQKVVKQIERMCNNISLSNRTKDAQLDTKVQFTERDLLSCIEKMDFTPAEDELKRIIRLKGRVIEEACSWIVKDVDDFAESSSPVMWIHGDAGKGKTMMSSFIIGHLKKNSAARVYFFFCQHDSDEHRSAVSILKSLICQILLDSFITLEKRLFLSRHLIKSFEIQGSKFLSSRNAEDSMKRILETMLLEIDPSFIVIDGLDECELQSLSSITESITESMLPMTMNSSVKYLLTSRNQPRILQQRLSDFTEVRLEKNEFDTLIRKGVRAYISARIDESERTGRANSNAVPSDRSLLPPGTSYRSYKDQLCSQAGDSFIWASLICNQIRDHGSEFLSAFLEDCPKGLGPLYSRILRRILHFDHEGDSINDQSDRLKQIRSDMSRRILRALCAAERALNIEELQIAVDYAHSKAAEIPFQTMIEDCSGLVVIESNEVRFIHLSVKNYLQEKDSQQIFGLSFEQAHFELTESCMHLISQAAFLKSFGEHQWAKAQTRREQEVQELPFESYSISNVMLHALEAMKSSIHSTSIKTRLEKFFSSSGGCLFYGLYVENYPEYEFSNLESNQTCLTNDQKLHLCAFFGFLELLDDIFDSARTIYNFEFIRTLVNTAVAQDHATVVMSILHRLKMNANVSLIDGQCEASEEDMRSFAIEKSLISGSEVTWKAIRPLALDHPRILLAAILGDNGNIVRDVIRYNMDNIQNDICIASAWSRLDNFVTKMGSEWVRIKPLGDRNMSALLMKPRSRALSKLSSRLFPERADVSQFEWNTLKNIEALLDLEPTFIPKSRILCEIQPSDTFESSEWQHPNIAATMLLLRIRMTDLAIRKCAYFSFNAMVPFSLSKGRSVISLPGVERYVGWVPDEDKEMLFSRLTPKQKTLFEVRTLIYLGKPFQVAQHLNRRNTLRTFLAVGYTGDHTAAERLINYAADGWKEGVEAILETQYIAFRDSVAFADALHVSSWHGNLACVDALLSAGANGDMPTSNNGRSVLCQLACTGSHMALLYLLSHSSTAPSSSSFNSAVMQAFENVKNESAEFKAKVELCLSVLSEKFGDMPSGWMQRKTYDGWQYFIFDDGKTSFSQWQDPRIPFKAGESLDEVWMHPKPPFYDRDLEHDISLMSPELSSSEDEVDGDEEETEEEEEIGYDSGDNRNEGAHGDYAIIDGGRLMI